MQEDILAYGSAVLFFFLLLIVTFCPEGQNVTMNNRYDVWPFQSAFRAWDRLLR
jgi:hypothetical protein